MIGSLFVTGPAGTGKSSFSGALKEWFVENGYDVALVNLDPGAEFIPYEADYDIREMISLSDVMSQYNLGPNGAQIVASDLMVENSQEIAKELAVFEDYYVIFDTPGQIELFAFRPSSPLLIDQLSGGKAMLSFVTDAVLSTSPSGYISQKMLFGSIMSRFYKPMLFVLNKTDLVDDEQIEQIMKWESDPDELYDAFMEEKDTGLKDYFQSLLKSFKDTGMISKVIPVSSHTGLGMESVYSDMSIFFEGGTDSDTTYKDD